MTDTPRLAPSCGSEISFRLGPGTIDRARAAADRLGRAALAGGALRHVLFADADSGSYGCLAEWASRAEADRYVALATVRAEVDALQSLCGRPLTVRLYAMEERPVEKGW